MPPGWWRRLDRIGRGIENLLLIASLMTMIGIAVAQIVMRNAGITGLVWGDEFLRLLVLWLAIIGAVAASRDDHHIRIDILSKLVPLRVNVVVRAFVDLFTAAVCGIIAYHAVRFVASTREFEDVALGGLPLWVFQLILPIGFGLICYRYALWGLRRLYVLATGEDGYAP